MFFFFNYTAVCDPRSARTVTGRVRFSEAGEVCTTLSRPGRALARRADGDVPFDDARTRDCLPSQLGRTTGGSRRSGFPRSNRQSRTAGAADGRASVPGRTATAVGRLPAAHRSGRVSGIRPSDRRGPGPAGHRGRNVRSTGRCSYNLRITRRRADSCGLHRSTSQVIRRSGSGVYIFFFFVEISTATPCANTTEPYGLSTVTIFRSTLGRGSRRAGGRRTGRERTRPRGRIRRARDRQVLPVPRARL